MTSVVSCRIFLHFMSSLFNNLKTLNALTQDLQIFKKFNMSQMNPNEVLHNTAYSVQLPYIAGHSL